MRAKSRTDWVIGKTSPEDDGALVVAAGAELGVSLEGAAKMMLLEV